MKVGILGSGPVARALGAGFLKYGYAVMLGTRDRAKLSDWATQHDGAEVGSFADAARYGELLVLAVKGSKAADVMHMADSANVAGKTIIDTTNPIADEPPVNGVLKYFTDLNESLMERLQREYPEARLVKAFSSVGNRRMVDPNFGAEPPTMFICGNDGEAKRDVQKVLNQFGWETADMGGVEAARAIEPLAMLWCIPGFLENRWDHAFKLLK